MKLLQPSKRFKSRRERDKGKLFSQQLSCSLSVGKKYHSNCPQPVASLTSKIDWNQNTSIACAFLSPNNNHPSVAQVTKDKIPTPDRIIGAKNTGLLCLGLSSSLRRSPPMNQQSRNSLSTKNKKKNPQQGCWSMGKKEARRGLRLLPGDLRTDAAGRSARRPRPREQQGQR